ncbi:MAG: methylated-DNA--[protein]-cysteine S-methyltransferase [Dehalococcoidia bacterium]|nr:methylated-DNA--[protein]-cysteine S-methyltransferase [Dehalococcoidia bacterium]
MVAESPAIAIAETPMGFAGVALSDAGIRYATLFHRTREAALGELRAHGAVERDHPLAARAIELLEAYGRGEGDLGDFPVDLPACSDLQRRAWLALRDIPKGETRSYGWLARHVGEGAGASRAIGTAMGKNPVPLWLPCHRVVASDGTLHGFGGGLAMKQALLELEGALPARMV